MNAYKDVHHALLEINVLPVGEAIELQISALVKHTNIMIIILMIAKV